MRQSLGKALAFTPSAGAPSGDDADRLQMSGFGTGSRVKKYLLKIKMTGAGAVSADFYLYGRAVAAGDWGNVGEKDGRLNGDATISGTTTVVRFFVLENLGPFLDLYLEKRNEVGSPTSTGELTEYIEQGD